jgi:hypothetical protein
MTLEEIEEQKAAARRPMKEWEKKMRATYSKEESVMINSFLFVWGNTFNGNGYSNDPSCIAKMERADAKSKGPVCKKKRK